jgi:Phage protein.
MDLTASDHRPPCWPAGTPCPNACAAQVRDQVTRNHVRLHGPWAGWRLAGRELVSPDGVRMSAERVRGLAWRVEQEARIAAARAKRQSGHRGMVTVLRVRNSDWHAERFGQRAG